jgi:hypothetical protein
LRQLTEALAFFSSVIPTALLLCTIVWLLLGSNSQKTYKQKRHSEWKVPRLCEGQIKTYEQSVASKKAPNEKILWSYRSLHPFALYPQIEQETLQHPDDAPRRPTAEEIAFANRQVYDPSLFTLYTHDKVAVVDAANWKKVIAVMKFTKMDDLSPQEYDNLSFLSSFLHASKTYVNPVACPSRSWGGRMWALGWRKAMVTAQLIGHYICQSAVDRNKLDYDNLMQALNILGEMFNKMAAFPFNKNRSLMMQHDIPSFANLKFYDPIAKYDCSPHLTFTSVQQTP